MHLNEPNGWSIYVVRVRFPIGLIQNLKKKTWNFAWGSVLNGK